MAHTRYCTDFALPVPFHYLDLWRGYGTGPLGDSARRCRGELSNVKHFKHFKHCHSAMRKSYVGRAPAFGIMPIRRYLRAVSVFSRTDMPLLIFSVSIADRLT
jgi:hypothetical protein